MDILPEHSIIREFEYKISNYCGAKYSLSVCNATIGILGAFYALGLSNAEVISTPLTWSGSFSGLKMLNCKIKFCDIEPENLTINPDLIEPLISSNTKAVFSADFLGYPARLDRIKEICAEHNLLLIHDAASSFGSRYKGLYSGYYADVTILSFGAIKIFSIGEGGCILTESSEIYERLKKFLMHPIRQTVECYQSNSFALNTNINPYAVKFAIDNFDQKIIELESNREKSIACLKQNFLNQKHPSFEPNYYKIIVPIKYLVDYENDFLIDALPFDKLIYMEPDFCEHDIELPYSCPVAENAINNYYIISI